ncbi:MAG: hypothetical protein V4561_09750 [Bacteroidota bacterium]
MIRLIFRNITLSVLLISSLYNISSAANYYWRAVSADNLFTNVGNWETSPGGGLSPSLAPGVNDDVFFPVNSSISTINLNSGNCRDFNVTAIAPANFLFTGILTAINGSLNCPNGNATFNFGGTQNFIGTGTHTINMGTSAIRLNGFMTFSNGSGIGSYNLIGPINTNGVLTFNSQNFNSNGFPVSAYQIIISGNTPKTINLSNSSVIINKQGSFGSIQFLSAHTTTTYNLAGTHFTINDSTVTNKSGIVINPGVQITFDTLTLNKTTTSSNSSIINVIGSSVTPAIINMNVLRLNIANLALGANSFDNTSITLSQCVLNIGNLMFMQRSTITADRMFTLNVGAITESPVCQGQSSIVSVGYSPIFINTSVPIITNNIAFYGITFGGSGITTSISNDLGNNNGLVTWGTIITGINYWWVGGNGNWNDPTEWSIIGSGGAPLTSSGCLPTIYDNVLFDANSFSGSQTVTIVDGDAYCNSINWSGSNLGLLTGGVLLSGDIFLGNLFIKADADFSGARGIAANLLFVGNGTNTITSGSAFTYACPAIKIMGTGTHTLNDNLQASSSISYLQHTAGTFNTGGFTIDVANFCSRSFPESASNPRTLTITNSQINIRDIISSVVSGRRHIDLSFLSTLNAANSEFRIHSADVSANFFITKGNTSATYLTSADFNNISFIATSGSPIFSTNTVGGGSYTVNFNNINFSSNARIACASGTITHNVNNYNLVSGATYSFTQASGTSPTFNVLGNINHTVSGCQELVRIQSSLFGTRARINKATGPFNIDGAIVADINSVGATLNITNGVDAGNNLNVTILAATSRTMYWVNNVGNWDNGTGHWSIGVSGGDPLITNPLGCIPRIVDDVIFDNNSFSSSGQTVSLNVDGNCRNMLWTSSAGADAPIFSGALARNLNIYGSLELGTGMTHSFNGRTYMQGINTAAFSQSIDMNGVSTNGSIWMNGGGRYDLIDSVRIITADQGIRLERGNFVTNGNRIYAGALTMDVSGGNAADISNSYIHLFSVGNSGIVSSATYSAFHSATGTWNASGSNIQSDFGVVSISNTIPVSYGSITMNSTTTPGISGSSNQPITFNNIMWLQTPSFAAGGSRMDGIFFIDTLSYPLSSLNTFQTGGVRSYTINDTLIAFGTPCNPTFIRSATPGLAASISNTSCNFDFNFVNLRDINALTCTAAQNKSIGTDEGGNTNWTITSIPGLTKLGNDTAIVCGGPTIALDAIGFGKIPGILYAWNTGSSSRTINVNAADTYSIVVTYGIGCTVSDSIIVSCSSILPIKGLHLTGSLINHSISLQWQTLTAQKLSHFNIERSTNGINFETIATLKAAENNNIQNHYSLIDKQPSPERNFYRIKQSDINEQITYSNTIRVDYNPEGKNIITVTPNPVVDYFEIRFSQKGEYNLKITNAQGQIVWEQETEVTDIAQGRRFSKEAWPEGVYYLIISSPDNGYTQSFQLSIL